VSGSVREHKEINVIAEDYFSEDKKGEIKLKRKIIIVFIL